MTALLRPKRIAAHQPCLARYEGARWMVEYNRQRQRRSPDPELLSESRASMLAIRQ
jgi:hypothetical protein